MIKSKPVRLAKKKTVTFTYSDAGLEFQWSHDAPGSLPDRLFKRYIAARDEFLQTVANQLNGSVWMIDENGLTTIHPAVKH